MDGVQRKGNPISSSPAQTPRSSDKSHRDYRLNDQNGFVNYKNDKGVNIQVILRCRPLSEEEKRLNTPVVISCNEHRREVSAVQSIANKTIDKTFNFDRVFGPSSQQKDLFDSAISPVVNEVLEGYNCTVFAYGQTGTGKTYTMEGGGRKPKHGEFPNDAGVIPRSVRQIFDTLEAQNAEYNMKVTFLELYNEEITDLFAPDESKFADEKSKRPMALMEDGKGCVFVRGLEEEIVSSANEIYRILEKGSSRRRTAETFLNKQSSRSHSIFSITIHIKEYTHEGEEMIKCGKLNLVDLAGSENISRSGAKDGRARETGEINKSLLTLGRVINALVEHSGHVPYRDSKLTRLLRDSLGGKTKTCIIATISPSIHSLEETLNTLDYAQRAKSIKNKPEINQRLLKSAMIKDLCSDIDRLKQELYAAREKNGIYIPKDRFLQEESEKKAMAEKIERLELSLESKDKELVGLQELYNSQQQFSMELSKMLDKTQRKLDTTEHALLDLEEKHRQANRTIEEKEYFVSNLLRSEKAILNCAFELRSGLESATTDIYGLFDKIERKDKIEEENRIIVQRFRNDLNQRLQSLHETVSISVTQQESHLEEMEKDMLNFISSKTEAAKEDRGRMGRLRDMFSSGISLFNELIDELGEKSQRMFKEVNGQVSDHLSTLENRFKGVATEADHLLNELQDGLNSQEEKLSTLSLELRAGFVKYLENARSITNVSTEFFNSLDAHALTLISILEEAQASQSQQLLELEKKFEEFAANEENELIERIAEMLRSSNARKKELVKTAVDSLQESSVIRKRRIQEEMSTARDHASQVKRQWSSYLEQTERNYKEDNASVDREKSAFHDGINTCITKAMMGSGQWRKAEDSIRSLAKEHADSIHSIVRDGLEANLQIGARFSLVTSSVVDEAQAATGDLLSSIDSNLNTDHGAWERLSCQIGPCRDGLSRLRTGHHQMVVGITAKSKNCLEEEYLADEVTCATPRRREVALLTVRSIEELRSPPLDELLTNLLVNRNSKQLHSAHENGVELAAARDPRLPVTAFN
ncbi:P-loop containing nucleoside triphosphate hydrolases superfamily protein [Wolffia australiana]